MKELQEIIFKTVSYLKILVLEGKNQAIQDIFTSTKANEYSRKQTQNNMSPIIRTTKI